MDFAVEEGKKSPPLHTLYTCYKATEIAGQSRIAWKEIHHPNSHILSPLLFALRQSCQQLVSKHTALLLDSENQPPSHSALP